MCNEHQTLRRAEPLWQPFLAPETLQLGAVHQVTAALRAPRPHGSRRHSLVLWLRRTLSDIVAAGSLRYLSTTIGDITVATVVLLEHC